MEKKKEIKRAKKPGLQLKWIVRNWIEPWQYFQKIKITYKLLQTLDMLLWKQPEQIRNFFSLSHVEILGRFQEILCAEEQKQLKARASMEGPKDSSFIFFFFFFNKVNSKTKFTSLPLPSWFPLHTHNTKTEAPTQK